MSNPESVEGPGEFYNLNVNVEIDALRGTKVAAFREACLEKLSPYLNSESRGWAYFDTAYQCAITNDTKLVEIILLTSPVRDTDSSTTPYIKIVTNEMYTYEAVEQCLSEDIVVVLNDEAQYLVDAGILAGT